MANFGSGALGYLPGQNYRLSPVSFLAQSRMIDEAAGQRPPYPSCCESLKSLTTRNLGTADTPGGPFSPPGTGIMVGSQGDRGSVAHSLFSPGRHELRRSCFIVHAHAGSMIGRGRPRTVDLPEAPRAARRFFAPRVRSTRPRVSTLHTANDAQGLTEESKALAGADKRSAEGLAISRGWRGGP